MPRYRQRLQLVPGRLANPVWVDDPDFEIGYHVRRSALPRPGRPPPAARARRPDRVPPAGPQSTAVGDLLRRGPRGRPGRRPDQEPPDPGRRSRDRGHRPGAARHRPRTRRDLGHDEWQPRGRPSALGLAVDAVTDTLERPGTAAPDGAGQRRVGRADRHRGRAPGRRRRRRPGRPEPGPRQPDQPAALAAAPVPRGPHRARGLQAHPHRPRRHGQRRRPGHHRRRPARAG